MGFVKTLNFTMPSTAAAKAIQLYDLGIPTGYTCTEDIPTSLNWQNDTSDKSCPMTINYRNVQSNKPVSSRVTSQYVDKNARSATGTAVVEAIMQMTNTDDPTFRRDSVAKCEIRFSENLDGIWDAASELKLISLAVSALYGTDGASLLSKMLIGTPKAVNV